MKVMKNIRYSSVGTSTGSSGPPHVPLVYSSVHSAPPGSPMPWWFVAISALEKLAR